MAGVLLDIFFLTYGRGVWDFEVKREYSINGVEEERFFVSSRKKDGRAWGLREVCTPERCSVGFCLV